MRLLRGSGWRTLTLELFIIFVGLWAALQVDQWQEARNYREAETRYLVRLKGDLDASIEQIQWLMEQVDSHYEGVRHVHESLAAGEIIDGDTGLFEHGLIYVGHLPTIPVHRSAYDEMVASGMFARLRSERLKSIVSDLYTTKEQVDTNFSWWRDGVLRLSDQLDSYVEFYSEGEPQWYNPQVQNEPERRVRFEFDALHDNRVIRNRFYWAADTHSDWVVWTGRLLTLAGEARDAVAGEIAARRR